MTLCICSRIRCKLSWLHFIKIFSLPYCIIKIISFNEGNKMLRIDYSQIFHKTRKALIQNLYCIIHNLPPFF